MVSNTSGIKDGRRQITHQSTDPGRETGLVLERLQSVKATNVFETWSVAAFRSPRKAPSVIGERD